MTQILYWIGTIATWIWAYWICVFIYVAAYHYDERVKKFFQDEVSPSAGCVWILVSLLVFVLIGAYWGQALHLVSAGWGAVIGGGVWFFLMTIASSKQQSSKN